MKQLLLLLALSVLSISSVHSMGRQPANSRASDKALPLIATPEGSYIAGGEQAQNGLWNGKTMESALTNSKVIAAEAELIVATSFGEDVAPDQPIVDTEALKAKNDLGSVIKSLTSSKSPAASGALIAAQAAFDQMKSWSEPVPQGDRKGAQQVVVMRGTSADVRAYGISHNESIAAIRAKTVPRANAAQTTTRTSDVEWTDTSVSNIVAGVTALGEMYFSTEAMRIAAEENETAIDPVSGAPIPTPVVDNGDGTVSATSQEGDQNLLVKPVGNNGGIVILLPAKFNNTITSVTLAGKPLKFSAVANGDRSHWRGDKCSTYGDNAKLVFVSSGTPSTVNVASPCTRWQTTVAKPVSASSIMPEVPAASTNSTGVAAAPGE